MPTWNLRRFPFTVFHCFTLINHIMSIQVSLEEEWWDGPVLTSFSDSSSMRSRMNLVWELLWLSISALRSPIMILLLNSEQVKRSRRMKLGSYLILTSGDLLIRTTRKGRNCLLLKSRKVIQASWIYLSVLFGMSTIVWLWACCEYKAIFQPHHCYDLVV